MVCNVHSTGLFYATCINYRKDVSQRQLFYSYTYNAYAIFNIANNNGQCRIHTLL